MDVEDCGEEYNVLFERGVCLQEGNLLGQGNFVTIHASCILQLLYDDVRFGHVIRVLDCVTSEASQVLCESEIAMQTSLRLEELCGVWTTHDISLNPQRRRLFKVVFETESDTEEFSHVFQEGKDAAVKHAASLWSQSGER